MKSRLLKHFLLWSPVLAWCGIIFFFSSMPYLKIAALGGWDFVLRKIAHFAEYAILTLFIFRAINGSFISNVNSFSLYFWNGFSSFFYAISDEYHQHFIAGRYCTPGDVLIDSLGIISMLYCIKLTKETNIMKKILLPSFLLTFLIFGLNGCGVEYKFTQAKKLEKKGSYVQAIDRYLIIANKYPGHKLAPGSLYNAAVIYNKKLNIPSKANDLFCEIIKNYSDQEKWVDLAKNGIFNLYNYFPLSEGNSWTEGDSQSLGKNMKMIANCHSAGQNLFKITKSYYAGKKIVENLKNTKFYRKRDLELQESQTADFKQYAVLLKYPFEKGNSWTTSQDNRKVKITYTAIGVKANVKCGYFERCIKVKEEDVNLSRGCKYKYYAENTGQILTTVGTDKKEYNVSELLSCQLANPDLQQ